MNEVVNAQAVDQPDFRKGQGDDRLVWESWALGHGSSPQQGRTGLNTARGWTAVWKMDFSLLLGVQNPREPVLLPEMHMRNTAVTQSLLPPSKGNIGRRGQGTFVPIKDCLHKLDYFVDVFNIF